MMTAAAAGELREKFDVVEALRSLADPGGPVAQKKKGPPRAKGNYEPNS